ncbi:reverse transcriptase domain protein [Fusarium beomiforme]|uniref:Reverse transcriptase domain protein n=1 Tax=Fusarium beomiforme TaxID=44412 RepID=A0A9P5AE71_9HYPO|nr:reverse transcriptase domain protein [Fusarium beomiforme]
MATEEEEIDKGLEEIQQTLEQWENELRLAKGYKSEHQLDFTDNFRKEQLQQKLEKAVKEKAKPLTKKEKDDILIEDMVYEMDYQQQIALMTANDCPMDINCTRSECKLQVSEELEETELLTKALRMTTKDSQKTCLELKVRIKGKWLKALVDSGADINFISPNTVNELRLPWKKKQRPYIVRSGEGDAYKYENGRVTREIDHLKVFVNGKNQGINFDIIPARSYDLVLGYPWLQRYNPQFNWRTGQITSYEEHPSDDKLTDSEHNDERS